MKLEENSITWLVKHFDQLENTHLYQLMQLRVDVFVVEQNCIYRELDGQDTLPGTLHILGFHHDQLVAYARAMEPTGNQPDSQVKIGRVVIHPDYRRFGLAREMMRRLLSRIHDEWPVANLFLSAQTQVAEFYQSLGFTQISAEYVEDGIPHIDMECKS